MISTAELVAEIARYDAEVVRCTEATEAAFRDVVMSFAAMLDAAMDARAREIVFNEAAVTRALLDDGRLPVLKQRLYELRANATTIARDALMGSTAWYHLQPQATQGVEVGRELRPVMRQSGNAELSFEFRADVDALGRQFDVLFREFGYRNGHLQLGSTAPTPHVVNALIAYADAVQPLAEAWEKRDQLLRRRDQAAALDAWDAIGAPGPVTAAA